MFCLFKETKKKKVSFYLGPLSYLKMTIEERNGEYDHIKKWSVRETVEMGKDGK